MFCKQEVKLLLKTKGLFYKKMGLLKIIKYPKGKVLSYFLV